MEDLPPCNETEIPGMENGSTNNGYVNRNRINPYTSNLGINDPTHMDLDSDRSSSEENSIQDHDFPLPQPEMELDESPHDEFSDPGSLVEQGLDDDHDVNVDWNQWFLAGIQSCMQDNEQSAKEKKAMIKRWTKARRWMLIPWVSGILSPRKRPTSLGHHKADKVTNS
ncbi:hypothetical protein PSTT_12856 [Puccinia striiformis]|uniref:Uncharacterized protein n=1 Tax=Puccinia striiformis TaxID=27350 RepID=A0A2S4UU86_9BASI|nr:hypothetical protein PSTT_12856 [Puccinia striiformis]